MLDCPDIRRDTLVIRNMLFRDQKDLPELLTPYGILLGLASALKRTIHFEILGGIK
ncbi:hypothetical protein D3C85_1574640 [compost metagenome]